MEWGPFVEFLEKEAERGRPSSALDDRPEVFADLLEDYQAFWRISKCRDAGFSGWNPIRLSEICAYADFTGIESPEERLRFLERVKAMDEAFLEYCREKSEAEREKP